MSLREEVAESFAARFRRHREALGLTQTALADGRYTVSYLSQIEAGKKRPTGESLAYFASRLHISATYLETGVPDGIPQRFAYELEEATVSLRRGRASDALDDSVRVIEETQVYDLANLRARALKIAGDALLLLRRPREAIDRYEGALELGVLSERERGLTTAALARAYRILGDLGYAGELIDSYLRAERNVPLDPAVVADLYTVQLQISFEKGDIYRAERAAERALAAVESGVSPSVRASVLWDASRVLAEARRWDEALDLATRSRVILEDLEDQRRLGMVHGATAFLCLEADPPRLGEADAHLDRAEDLLATTASPGDLAYLYSTRARVALLEDRPGDALALTERALEHTGADELERARVMFARGRALSVIGRVDAALGSFADAVSVFQKTGARQQEAGCWREIGELQLEAGRVSEAVESLRAGLEALDPRRTRA